MLVTVIIATRNRPNKIGNCLKSVLANSFSSFEIIVVDQSANNETKAVIQKIKTKKIKYIKLSNKGKSKALNLALKKASGKILAFTDDDCIVDKHWLKNIHLSFKRDKETSVVFGRVLPYRPKDHSGLHCANRTRFKKERVFTTPPQKRFIFLGNAFTIRRHVFEKIGFFKEWLGVGSIGMATEDEEIIYRLLRRRDRVLLSPQVVVYHDRWLTKKELRRRVIKYTCGFFAAFGFYALKGDKIAQDYLTVFMKEKFQEWQQAIKFCIKNLHPKYLFRLLLRKIPFELYYYLKGILIAFYFAIIKKN